VEKRADLGEWLGQCKYDKTGVARRVRGASSVAIKDYGEETAALDFVLNHLKEN
jgi:small subunit ribosomal protein S12e